MTYCNLKLLFGRVIFEFSQNIIELKKKNE